MASRTARILLVILTLALAGSATAQRFGGQVKPGPWNTRTDIPDGWVLHRTKNYQIQSECGIEKAKRLGEHMEVMNRVYRNLFRAGKGGAKQQVIKLLKDREAYLRYGAPPSSAAYYSRMDREMVCYDTGKWSDEDEAKAGVTGPKSEAVVRRMRQFEELMKMDILGCAAHEGWHQYFSWLVVSMITLPSWINEGMGDYFYTASPRSDGEQTRSKPAQLGQLNHGRLMILKAAIRQDRFVPIPELIHYTKNEYYANGSICYAEGWALCQFLLHSGDKKYEKIIPNFIKYVRNDTNMEAVTERVFRGIDLDKLNEEFLAWVATLKLPGEEEEKAAGDKDGKPAAGTGNGQ